jgi:hypothetical protein
MADMLKAQGRAEEIRRSTEEPDASLLAHAAEEGRADESMASYRSSLAIGYIAGVIPRSKAFLFEKILWRTLRGNLFVLPLTSLTQQQYTCYSLAISSNALFGSDEYNRDRRTNI